MYILRGAIEVGCATVLYMALPKSQRLSKFFGVRKDTLSGGALRGNIVLRLRHAAEALTQVHTSVEEISHKLSTICAPNLQGVYDRSVEAICAGCSARGVCWRKYKEETLENFRGLTKILREKAGWIPWTSPPPFPSAAAGPGRCGTRSTRTTTGTC